MKIENFGPIKELDFEFKKVNIICGANNTGKTYLSYFLYAYRKFLSEEIHFQLTKKQKEKFINETYIYLEINKLKSDIIEKIKLHLETDFKNYLGIFFNLEQDAFEEMKISSTKKEIEEAIRFNNYNIFEKYDFDECNTLTIETIKEKILIKSNLTQDDLKKYNSKKKEVMFMELFKRVNDSIMNHDDNYYFPAERIGLNLFKDQLDSSDIRLASLIKAASFYNSSDASSNFNIFSRTVDLINGTNPDYARPIADYLEFLRNIDYSSTNENSLPISFLRDEILNGKISIVDDKIYFRKRIGEKRYQKK